MKETEMKKTDIDDLQIQKENIMNAIPIHELPDSIYKMTLIYDEF